MPSTKLLIDDVSMKFGTQAGVFHALDHVSLAVPQGRFVSLIGPSGCGKSTIFNVVTGLQAPSDESRRQASRASDNPQRQAAFGVERVATNESIASRYEETTMNRGGSNQCPTTQPSFP